MTTAWQAWANLLEQRLDYYRQFYGAYNHNPQQWEAEHGAWTVFEHCEKAQVLGELGQILTLLQRQTLHEGQLDTPGDVEYYSTVKEALRVIRQFLEQHPPRAVPN
ncbi:MAG: hypothetical protein NZL92_08245 [Gloeomargarita sp. SKYG116]|nr:hypothetical protein [Gloeomargarita sp. SKYG116]MCS7293623.1 hypothetical protein [Gloeomargarita sp. SKYB120]MDW8179189.1 hypothetical protein [Gloeomargarita sp. SKYBB_i_bin120]MDW8401672.1 hypothetical protein [Gloeomargarita sp. SKYGB_i_bin116]